MEHVHNASEPAALETREIKIAGMGCDNCVKKLERALRARDGIKDVSIDGISGRATVTFESAKLTLTDIQEVVAKSGYRAGAVA
jgi:copper chaperone CopZ